MFQNSLILLLGGSGSRFGGKIPKQFLDFPCQATDVSQQESRQSKEEKYPLFACTCQHLLQTNAFSAVVFVVNPQYLQNEIFLQSLQRLQKNFPHVQQFISEGKSNRHKSFRSGWQTLLRESSFEAKDIRLAVHDANRPHLSQEFLQRMTEHLSRLSFETPCFVPAVASVDSMLQTDGYGNVLAYVPRERIKRVQTPQLLHGEALAQKIPLENSSLDNSKEKKKKIFRPEPLEFARHAENSNAELADFGDEGSMMLHFGYRVSYFQGDLGNKKITYKEDV